MIKAFIGGLAGALSVTILHELIRKADPDAPRLDKLGMQATEQLIERTGHKAPTGDTLYVTSLTGDIIANTFYYSLIGLRKKHPMKAGAGMGLLAGLGAVTLPESMGLDPAYSAGTWERKGITVGLYTLGGLISGAVICLLKNKHKRP